MDDAALPLLDAFARMVRKHRLSAGLSQEELAHRAGLSMRYVSLLESRKHQPSLATLNGLATALGMSLTALVSEIEAEVHRAEGGSEPL